MSEACRAPASARCRCPACEVAAAIVLLERGRGDMALDLLRPLPARLEAAQAPASRRGRAAPKRPAGPEAPAGGRGRPGFRREAEELLAHVARLGVERVAEVLRVYPYDILGMLEGRVEPPKSGMAKLRREPEDDVPF